MNGRRTALLAIVLLVSGCATAAQRQYQGMSSNGHAAAQALQTCVTAAYDSPEFAPVRAHLPLNSDNASLEQLSSSQFPTDDEVRAILITHPKYQLCREAYLNRLSQTTPSLAAIYASQWSKAENHLVDLIQKKQTWGEFLRGAREQTADLRLEINHESQRIMAGLNRSNEAELARRQAASNAMMQFYQTQQIINSMNRPVMTTCTALGNTANCISQ